MKRAVLATGAAVAALLALDPEAGIAQGSPGGANAGVAQAQNRNSQPQPPSLRDVLAEDVAAGRMTQEQANQLLVRAQQIRETFERQARDAGGAVLGNLRDNALDYQQDAIDLVRNQEGSGRSTGEGAARSIENLVMVTRSVNNNLRLPLETYLNGANELLRRRAEIIGQNPSVPVEERRRIARESEQLNRYVTRDLPAALDMREAALNRVRADVDNRSGEIAAAYTEMERRYGPDPRRWPQQQRPRPVVVMRTPPPAPPPPAPPPPPPAPITQPEPQRPTGTRPSQPRPRVNQQGQQLGPDGRPLQRDTTFDVTPPSPPPPPPPPPPVQTARRPVPPPPPPPRRPIQPVDLTSATRSTRNIDPPLDPASILIDAAARVGRAARDLGRAGGGGASGSGGEGFGGLSTRATLAGQRSFVEGVGDARREPAFILGNEWDWQRAENSFEGALDDLAGLVPDYGELPDAWASFELGGTLTVAELEPIYAGWDINTAPPGSSGRSFSAVGNSLPLDWSLPAYGPLSTQLAADRAAGLLAGYATDGWTLGWGEWDIAASPVRVNGDGRAPPGTLAAYLRDNYYVTFPSLWDGGLGLGNPWGYRPWAEDGRELARALYGPLWSDRRFSLIRDPSGRLGRFSDDGRLAGYLADLSFDELLGLLLRGGLGGLDRLLAQPFNVVLTWGAGAFDVDLHMTGPTGQADGSRFWIYYAQTGALEDLPFAQLIRDCICASGSEVILTTRLNQGGVYRISAFNFGNQSTTSTQLSTNADLELLIVRGGVAVPVGNGTTIEGGRVIFRGSPTPNRPGNTWVGVEIDPRTGQIRFVDRSDNSVNGDGTAGNSAASAAVAAPAAITRVAADRAAAGRHAPRPELPTRFERPEHAQ